MICPYMSGVDFDGHLVKVECQTYDCAKYVQILGTDPQTGQEKNEWKCSDAWVPLLLVENSLATRQTNASVHSFRNDLTKAVNSAAGRLSKQTEKEICQE